MDFTASLLQPSILKKKKSSTTQDNVSKILQFQYFSILNIWKGFNSYFLQGFFFVPVLAAFFFAVLANSELTHVLL